MGMNKILPTFREVNFHPYIAVATCCLLLPSPKSLEHNMTALLLVFTINHVTSNSHSNHIANLNLKSKKTIEKRS